ncbi:MAG: roadblock/LC7 domain-containing protein [Verrucomicrobiota bacterium]
MAVSELMEAWPPPVQQEIEQLQLRSGKVCLPVSRLDSAMKTGRVVFTWGELCSWLQPPTPENLAANRETALELPLKVIAPLFMARRHPGAAQKKVTIAAQIPDIFAGMAKAPEAAAAAAAVAAPAAAIPVAASAAAGASGLGEIFGQPGKMEWSPQDITRNICALKGVAGSVLAMSDGLLMAGQLPAPMRTETVAAFMPQIVGRVSQYAGEMQLGPVTGVLVAAGRGQCALYKAGKLYLAVLGHPGEALPEGMLGRIAAEIARRNP